MSRLHRLLLWSAATDHTFHPRQLEGRQVLVGKCLHCSRKLVLELSGKPVGSASLEHIVPRSQGGTDNLDNLAVACSSCNHEKGRRHDWKSRTDARAQEVVSQLQARRSERYREPPTNWMLPSKADLTAEVDDPSSEEELNRAGKASPKGTTKSSEKTRKSRTNKNRTRK